MIRINHEKSKVAVSNSMICGCDDNDDEFLIKSHTNIRGLFYVKTNLLVRLLFNSLLGGIAFPRGISVDVYVIEQLEFRLRNRCPRCVYHESWTSKNYRQKDQGYEYRELFFRWWLFSSHWETTAYFRRRTIVL